MQSSRRLFNCHELLGEEGLKGGDHDVEPGLGKMAVECRGILQGTIFHYQEGNAVGQRPVLVGAAREEIEPPVKKVLIGRDNCNAVVGLQVSQKREKEWPVCGLGHGIRQLDDYPSGCHGRSVEFGRPLRGRRVVLVERIDQRQIIGRVGENRFYFLGVPYK